MGMLHIGELEVMGRKGREGDSEIGRYRRHWLSNSVLTAFRGSDLDRRITDHSFHLAAVCNRESTTPAFR